MFRFFILLSICSLCFSFSYAYYYDSKQQPLLTGYVSSQPGNDIIIKYFRNGIEISTVPSSDIIYNNYTCTNSAVVTYNPDTKSTTVSNITTRNTSCNVYFITPTTYPYSYTGTQQTFTAQVAGYYKIELWGANGGQTRLNSHYSGTGALGGSGGYTSGVVQLNAGDILYVYIGGTGGQNSGTNYATGGTAGWNGGAKGSNGRTTTDGWVAIGGSGGGGASDIRYNGTTIYDRIMVAGGGGGSVHNYSANYRGGVGGNLYSGDTKSLAGTIIASATQISGYSFGTGRAPANPGGNLSNAAEGRGGGGGGYWGGNATTITSGTNSNSAASGGSSFISGYAGSNAITASSNTTPTNLVKHYSGNYFLDGYMEAGVNAEAGRGLITYIGTAGVGRINTSLDSVRYIRSCMTGSSLQHLKNIGVKFKLLILAE